MKVNHIPCGPTVNESERKAFERLKGRLISEPGDDEWLLLTNLAFSATHRRQSDEVDIVAIGPPGIQVIEVKHWTEVWVRRNPELVEQEADRVTDKARKIGTTLRKRVESLPRVDGAFLVTQATAKVAALENREHVRGVPFHTLKTCLDAIGFHARKVLSPEQIRELGAVLDPGSAVATRGTLKRMAGYARLDLWTSADQRFHRVYDATHTSRQDRVKLHLYDLSASDDANVNERAEREWKSLQRLQQHAWAPRIVDSFQDAPGYPGEIKFFTLADPDAPSIEQRAADASWDTNARLAFSRSSVRALQEFHEEKVGGEPMVHRNLTPSTILVKHDNSPILTGFEHTRIPTDVSVASPSAEKEWEAEAAPEVRAQGRGAADHRSDIYSLCASLAVLFKDREDEVSASIATALVLGMDDDPGRRSSLPQLDEWLSDQLGEPIPEPSPPPARFWTEDQVVPFGGNSYRIVSRLGSGGAGTAFKVVKLDRETKGDLGTYVAKIVGEKVTGQRVLQAYNLAHAHLRHSALSTIFEVATEWRENGFVALMTWIEGEPLGEYAGLIPLLAEELHQESGETLALGWLRTACEALRILHHSGLVHGDVSPRNMIVSGADLVLTDYDCVTKIGARATAPGTILYCSPSYLEGRNATPSDDFYALAASFFQALFDREPFRYDGDYAKERGLNWNDLDRTDYPRLSEFLNLATDPNPERRLASVEDALATLGPSRHAVNSAEDHPPKASADAADIAGSSSTGSKIERIERRENEVLWLKSLLQSYPGSLWGNSETRGLDTDFAAETFVETDLEQALYQDIVERRISLVILCGNAGDGKTALLQHLAKRFGLDFQTSATRILKGRLDDGLSVRMNLDGSASWRGRSADDLLDEFLEPFRDGQPDGDIAHLLAINDGRLLEWIENVDQRYGETSLTRDLSDFLENEELPSGTHIRFVNLNRRSLVGGIAGDGKTIKTGFLDLLVDALYGGERAAEIWAPCSTCSAQEHCEVFRAARIFGPGALADDAIRDRARERLFESLQAVHLRGETHITVRELRATLVYVLFGIQYCSDYHSVADGSGLSIQPYWNRAFSPNSPGRQGEVLRELPRFDPALEAQPQIDRCLLHPLSGDAVTDFSVPKGLNLESARRYAYFEWTQETIKQLTHDPDALGLIGGHHLRQFRDLAVCNDDKRYELVTALCGGISRLEALPPLALDRSRVVPLRISPRTPTETAFWVEKSIDDFRLEADVSDKGPDRLHRQAFLIYRYRNGREERLRIGADLFHLLLELNEGYQLGDVASDDMFAHLSIFVQRLVQEDHRQMLVWNPMREEIIFEIAAKIDETEFGPRQRLSIMPIEQPGESDGE